MQITLDFTSRTPLYIQLRNAIVIGIATGEMTIGERLPPIRRLAEEIGINPMTVSKVYTTLSNDGFLQIDRKRGGVVSLHFSEREAYLDRLADELRIICSEASLRGITKNNFLSLCEKMFDGNNSTKSEV